MSKYGYKSEIIYHFWAKLYIEAWGVHQSNYLYIPLTKFGQNIEVFI